MNKHLITANAHQRIAACFASIDDDQEMTRELLIDITHDDIDDDWHAFASNEELTDAERQEVKDEIRRIANVLID
jgi:hypothetical protein